MSKKIIYLSLDVESDGPAPLVHSMLSLGAVALDPTKGKGKAAIVSQWEANFEQLPTASTDPSTMDWWRTQPEAWHACRQNMQDPATAMRSFERFVKSLPGKVIPVGFPAGYDFTFVYVYCVKFLGMSPFGFAAFDFKTAAAVMLGVPYYESRKRNFPKHWFAQDLPHTHKAIDDALEQGVMLTNALDEYGSMRKRNEQYRDDIKRLNAEIDRLQAGIRTHRDERGHDRCWLDDERLYKLLPEGVSDGVGVLPPKDEFLRGCERYYELRRSNTHEAADVEARRLAAEGKLGK